MNEKKLAARIRRIRIDQGLTMVTAGRACGISKQAWHQWETGERSPRISSLLKIAGVLGVPAATLLDEEQEPCS